MTSSPCPDLVAALRTLVEAHGQEAVRAALRRAVAKRGRGRPARALSTDRDHDMKLLRVAAGLMREGLAPSFNAAIEVVVRIDPIYGTSCSPTPKAHLERLRSIADEWQLLWTVFQKDNNGHRIPGGPAPLITAREMGTTAEEYARRRLNLADVFTQSPPPTQPMPTDGEVVPD